MASNYKQKQPAQKKQATTTKSNNPTQGKKESVITINRGLWLPILYGVLFSAFAFYMLAVKNADYLYAIQERSLFLFDSSFFDMTMVKPGALMTYLGCFFTQFFYHPWLGTTMLIVSHNLLVIKAMCSKVLVMDKGKIVESGNTDEVLENPKAEATHALLKAGKYAV